jgi:hypothetical protein
MTSLVDKLMPSSVTLRRKEWVPLFNLDNTSRKLHISIEDVASSYGLSQCSSMQLGADVIPQLPH